MTLRRCRTLRRSKTLRRIGLVMVLCFSGGASESSGQEHLVSARARADFTRGDRVQVAITYVVRVTPESREVPLAGLLFGVDVSTVQVSIAGTDAPIEVTFSPGGRMSGSVPLGASAVDDGPVSFVLRYEVSEGAAATSGPRELRAPILAVMWPPAEAVPGIFSAEVLLPPELTVLGSFPADFREAEDVGEAGGRGYVAELPVLPALLSLRVTEGGGRLGITTLLDVAVLVLLGAVVVGGWRYLRGNA